MKTLAEAYLLVKAGHPDKLVMVRMGDFYEMLFDDAKVAANILQITLTQRRQTEGEAVPMAGVPAHSLKNALSSLVAGNKKVVVCERDNTGQCHVVNTVG